MCPQTQWLFPLLYFLSFLFLTLQFTHVAWLAHLWWVLSSLFVSHLLHRLNLPASTVLPQLFIFPLLQPSPPHHPFASPLLCYPTTPTPLHPTPRRSSGCTKQGLGMIEVLTWEFFRRGLLSSAVPQRDLSLPGLFASSVGPGLAEDSPWKWPHFMPLWFIPEASVLFSDRRVLGPDRASLPTSRTSILINIVYFHALFFANPDNVWQQKECVNIITIMMLISPKPLM